MPRRARRKRQARKAGRVSRKRALSRNGLLDVINQGLDTQQDEIRNLSSALAQMTRLHDVANERILELEQEKASLDLIIENDAVNNERQKACIADLGQKLAANTENLDRLYAENAQLQSHLSARETRVLELEQRLAMVTEPHTHTAFMEHVQRVETELTEVQEVAADRWRRLLKTRARLAEAHHTQRELLDQRDRARDVAAAIEGEMALSSAEWNIVFGNAQRIRELGAEVDKLSALQGLCDRCGESIADNEVLPCEIVGEEQPFSAFHFRELVAGRHDWRKETPWEEVWLTLAWLIDQANERVRHPCIPVIADRLRNSTSRPLGQWSDHLAEIIETPL